MKYRPILFSGPMVRAILEGRKTQTRRVVTIPRELHCEEGHSGPGSYMFLNDCPQEGVAFLKCPYGVPGDRLWVRETWAAPHAYDGMPPRTIPGAANWHYAATEERGGLLWRPSIHMPRWASRITLEVVSVRVERLQSISAQDAVAEGIELERWKTGEYPAVDMGMEWDAHVLREAYRRLWESINGTRPGFAWADNPWVWAVEFKRVEEVQS